MLYTMFLLWVGTEIKEPEGIVTGHTEMVIELVLAM